MICESNLLPTRGVLMIPFLINILGEKAGLTGPIIQADRPGSQEQSTLAQLGPGFIAFMRGNPFQKQS